jgi:endoglucanase
VIPAGSIGMWDFSDPVIRGPRIYARGCDDIAGTAALLCCIDALYRSRTPCDAYFLFTRAEEVGFLGAIAAARLGTVPKKCLVVSMETSSQRVNARIGDGPILRVGDKSTTFTPAVSAYCEQVAQGLAKSNRGFQYQRRLMDGGTCESSAFCAFGYEASGLCVALGNYHNVDAENKKLAPEFIDLRDWHHMVQCFIELAKGRVPYTGRPEVFINRLRNLEKRYSTLLRTSRQRPR